MHHSFFSKINLTKYALIFMALLEVFLISFATHLYTTTKLDAFTEAKDKTYDICYRLNLITSKEDFAAINSPADVGCQEYARIFDLLNTVRTSSNVQYVYTAKKTSSGKFVYLVDGMSSNNPDFRWPGDSIEDEFTDKLEEAYHGNTVIPNEIVSTEWGNLFTTFYPLYDMENPSDIYGVLGITYNMDKMTVQLNNIAKIGILSCCIVAAIFIFFFYLYRKEKRSIAEVELLAKRAKETDELLSNITQTLSCGVIAYDMEKDDVLLINEEARRIYEFTNHDYIIKGTDLQQMLSTEHENEIMHRFQSDEFDYSQIVFEENITHLDGNVLNVLVQVKFLDIPNRKLIIVTATEITDRVRLQNSLQFERQQYKEAILHKCIFSISFDVTEGKLTEDSILVKAYEILFHSIVFPIAFDEIVQRWKDSQNPIFLGEDWMSQEKLLCLFEKGYTMLETEIYYPNVKTYYSIMALLMKNEIDGHVYATIYSYDISENRKKEYEAKTQLEEALETAKAASQAKTDFLSKMSHDIRTPLNTIIGMTELASYHIDQKEKVDDYLHKIHVSGEHLLTLINEVLDMRKIEEGTLSLKKTQVNLIETINSSNVIIREDLDKHHHHLKIDLEEITHPQVFIDQLRMQQILINLLSNSIKYTPDGGELELCIKETKEINDRYSRYQFIIKDNGIGMSPSYIEKIFEPFSREEDSRTSKVSGTGLGMAIVKNLIDLMDGHIEIHSKLNEGTCTTITFILEHQNETINSSDHTEQTDSDSRLIAPANLKNKRVLLVEDQELNREIATEFLEMMDVTVDSAENGKQALDQITSSPSHYYDLILMDIQMPIMDGYQSTAAIRSLPREDTSSIPIIALTANSFAEDVQNAIDAGMNDHLAKPIDFGKIQSMLVKWL